MIMILVSTACCSVPLNLRELSVPRRDQRVSEMQQSNPPSNNMLAMFNQILVPAQYTYILVI